MSSRDLERGTGKGPAAGGYPNGGYNQTAYYPNNRRDSDSQWTSWLVPVIVVANVAVFIVAMYVNNCPRNNLGFEGGCVAKFLGRLSFQPLKENPLFGPSSDTLQKMGALEWDNVVHENQGWRLITCMWLHAGVIHLLANMLSLVFIGIRLEQQFGFVRVGAIYLISGFGGSILSSLFIRNNISVGASGALFGLLGAMLSELITNWTIYTNKAAALFTLIFIIAINLALGILPHVDNFAHIGGFLTGFLLGFILLIRPQFGWVERPYRPADARVKSKHMGYQYVLWLIALVLLIAGPLTSPGTVSWGRCLPMVHEYLSALKERTEMITAAGATTSAVYRLRDGSVITEESPESHVSRMLVFMAHLNFFSMS